MINIKTLEIAGFRSALEALRLPFGKECRSNTKFVIMVDEEGVVDDNNIVTGSSVKFDPKDLHLMSTLIKRGDEHAKVMRGIIVYAEVEAPVYFWCEAETYGVGHQRLSSESTMHVDCRGMSGDELVEAKSKIPMGKVLKKVDYFSYQTLRRVYHQRKNHRLPEWRAFCEWIESLPYAKELILTQD